eukprot:1953708-Pyramimonas_sp.AAC.1
MPCIPPGGITSDGYLQHNHRERLGKSQCDGVPDLGCCMVARQLPRREVEATPEACQALTVEWDKLVKQTCWKNSSVREYDDVIQEAMRAKKK